MNQTVQDVYLLYLTEFSPYKLKLFKEILDKTRIVEIALMNSTCDLLIDDELVGFMERYLLI